MNSSPLAELGAYSIEAELGRGGMGVVYLATQRGLGRHVALKVMNPSLAQDPEFVDRFSREATTLAKVDSPHIIAIYDHGRVGDVLYLATQYVAGGDLSTMIRTQGPTPLNTALELFSQILKGLRDAHRAGVIHRDVKPANILIRSDQTEPHVYLCDFGIAQEDGADQYTRTGMVAGSTAFLAPERSAGRPASVQSDLYSAACVLWVMLSGRNLYEGTDFQVASQHATGPIPQLRGAGAETEAINMALRTCLAKSPDLRPASADDLLQRIAVILGAARPKAVADTFVPPPPLPPALTAVAGPAPATLLRPTPLPTAPVAGTTAPAPAPSRGRAGLVAALVAGVVVLGLGVFALSRLLGGGASSTAVGASSSVAEAPAATERASTPVTYSCWDGTTATSLKKCGTPSGALGLTYVFPSLAADIADCELDSAVIERRPGTVSYLCSRGSAKLLYRYWARGADAQKHLETHYAGNPVRNDLILDGQVVGSTYRGKLTTGDYNSTASLLNSHFTVSAASSVSTAQRDALFDDITFRAVADLAGHPSNEEPRVATRG